MVILAALLIVLGITLFFLRRELASGKGAAYNVVSAFSAVLFLAGVALVIYHAAVM